jgi:hypothetical protein
MERAIFELNAIGLAAAGKFDGILVDERHVPQIQNQLLPRCLDGEQLLKLLDTVLVPPKPPGSLRAPRDTRPLHAGGGSPQRDLRSFE